MKFYLICYNGIEFSYWRNYFQSSVEHQGRSYSYQFVADKYQLAGLRDIRGAFCGDFRDRPDIQEIVQCIMLANPGFKGI